MTSDHLSPAQLRSLAAGAEDGELRIRMLDHVEACLACSTQLDQLLEADFKTILGGPIPPLGPDRKHRTERRVLGKIHGLALARQLLQLGFLGPTWLVRGFVSPRSPQTRRWKDE